MHFRVEFLNHSRMVWSLYLANSRSFKLYYKERFGETAEFFRTQFEEDGRVGSAMIQAIMEEQGKNVWVGGCGKKYSKSIGLVNNKYWVDPRCIMLIGMSQPEEIVVCTTLPYYILFPDMLHFVDDDMLIQSDYWNIAGDANESQLPTPSQFLLQIWTYPLLEHIKWVGDWHPMPLL